MTCYDHHFVIYSYSSPLCCTCQAGQSYTLLFGGLVLRCCCA